MKVELFVSSILLLLPITESGTVGINSRCAGIEHNLTLGSILVSHLNVTVEVGTKAVLICRSGEFINKTWSITRNNALAGGVWYRNGDVLFITECITEEMPYLPCPNPAELTCQGRRYSTGDISALGVALMPECGKPRPASSEYKDTTLAGTSTEALQTAMLDAQSANEEPKETKYLGLIIGFTVCALLACISCLIVLIHRKCCRSRPNKGMSSAPAHSRPDHQNDSTDPNQRQGMLRGPTLPITQFNKKKAGTYEL